VPLGIPLPSTERAKVYRVAVVSRSKELNESEPPQPFVAIDGAVTGEQHVHDGATPFRLGDVAPDAEFVHVIDFAGLWAVLTELDTITDFACYLDARSAFIRGHAFNSAANDGACGRATCSRSLSKVIHCHSMRPTPALHA
jgi:hypothetical protein